MLRRYTAGKRFVRAVKVVNRWWGKHRNRSLGAQRTHLSGVIRGHCRYYGLTGNYRRIARFRYQVTRIWREWLSRRRSRSGVNRERMKEVPRRHPLPKARIVRSIHATCAKQP